LLDDVESHLGVVEHRGIDALLRAHHHFLLLAQGLRELRLRDRAAVEARDLAGRVGAAKVIVDTEKRERQRDEREYELDNSLVLGDEVEHVRAPIVTSKRANSRSPFVLAEWTGLEPATPGVTGRYSNQLNYHSALVAAFWIAPQAQPNLASPRGFEPLLQP